MRPIAPVLALSLCAACASAPAPATTTTTAAGLRGLRIVSATAGSNGSMDEILLEVETDVTGGPLVGSTPCSSIFDGTSLVLRDAAGAEVYRQAHNVYCSPYDHGHPVELPDGVARTTVRFPLDGPVAWSGTTARLEGALAGRDDVPVASNDAAVASR